MDVKDDNESVVLRMEGEISVGTYDDFCEVGYYIGSGEGPSFGEQLLGALLAEKPMEKKERYDNISRSARLRITVERIP